MGRIRTIKPEFFTHEELSALPEATHLFAAGLLCYADDEGYFNANEGLVKAAIFPLRECSVSVHGMLNHLVNIGYLKIGSTADKKRWGRIVKFDAHQRVNRPTPSRIRKMEISWEESVNPHTHLTEDSLPEGKGMEWKGREQKPSRAKRERATKTAIVDERHTAFKQAIRRYWDSKNSGVDMPWGPADGKQLGMWLREAPHITLEQFTGFLRNRYKSDVNHGERPCQWLKWITSYGPGPVDRFKNTAQEEGNGANHQKGSGERISPAKERVNANRQVLAEIAIERGWYVPPGDAQPDGEAISEPGLDGRAAGVHEGPGKAGPEILPPRR